jgi:hypothetical protein
MHAALNATRRWQLELAGESHGSLGTKGDLSARDIVGHASCGFKKKAVRMRITGLSSRPGVCRICRGDYIVGLFSSERLHSILGNLPPSLYERKMADINRLMCPNYLTTTVSVEQAIAGLYIAHRSTLC